MYTNTTLFHRATLCAVVILALPVASPVFSATLAAGPGKTYSTPCRALTVAADGDTVEIDAATYDGDVCVIRASNLTIRGVNGRPKINANGQNAVGKGTWVLYGTNTIIDNVELSGAAVPNRDGAALRLDAPNLTLRNSYIHDNENGILTDSNAQSNVVIENTEFADNGRGDGSTHNLYIGNINSLVFRGSYSHDANVGHNLKSRARINTIVYSRFSASYNQPSYEIDLPNAGTSYIIGNVIQQPSANQAATMIGYGWEGASNPGRDLYVVNNTFLNEDSVRGTFVSVADGVGTPVLMQNNIFSGTGSASNQSNAIDRNNYRSLSPAFLDRSAFDLHPAGGAPMINAGAAPGAAASGVSIAPTAQYKFPVGTELRPVDGIIDIGAYEAICLVSSVVAAVPAVTPPVSTSVAPAPATALTSANSWINCAVENGTCNFPGTAQVRYGASGMYAYKTAANSIGCNNSTFGDPINGSVKSCSYMPSTGTSARIVTAPAPTVTAPAPAPALSNAVLKPVPPQPMPSKLLYTYFELYGAGNVNQATLFNQLNIFQGVFAQLSNPAAPATGELLPNYYSYGGATKEAVQAKREAGVRVGFTLGGEGAGGTVNMANYRTVARSVINIIIEKWGIIDFIDWNNFEAELYSDPAAMAAASRLISDYFSGTHSTGNDPTTGAPHAFPNRDLGQNFYIGSAPGAFDAAGMGGNIAVAIKNEMGLTRSYIGPQAYDGPGFELPSANQNLLNQWVSRGFPLSNIVWGSHPTTVDYSMSPDQSLAFYNSNAGLKGLYTFSYDDIGNLAWVQKMTPMVLLGQ